MYAPSVTPDTYMALCLDQGCPQCGSPATACLTPRGLLFPVANYCRKCGWIKPRTQGGKRLALAWLAATTKKEGTND